MEFKSRQQMCSSPRRVTMQDFMDRPMRSYSRSYRAGEPAKLQASSGRVDSMLTNAIVRKAPTGSTNAPSISVIKAQPVTKPAKMKLQQSRVLSRRSVARTQVSDTTAVSKSGIKGSRSRAQIALVTMAVLVFGFGVAVNVQTLQTNHTAKVEVAALAKKTSQAATSASASSPNNDVVVPSEEVPVEPETSRATAKRASAPIVEPDLPKLITISSLNVKAHVKPIGVTSKGELGVPYNIYETGWYNASARPGAVAANGAVLIDGHVVGPTRPGIFAGIKKMVAGDTIQITRTDNKALTYTVVKTQNYDAATLNVGMLLTSVVPGKPGLNLITCGGPFDAKTQHYTQRTVVFAVQQS